MIKTPFFELLYNDKNATHDIAQHFLTASYIDTLKGESDELSITLEDTDRKWMDTWYPSEGATLDFKIGYFGEQLLDCGRFEIDEITVNDSPNTVSIRALAAGVNSPIRTIKYRAFDKQTLDAIINEVASDLGYSVEGQIIVLPLDRITQKETDLAFIKRLSTQYGYIFKVKGSRLIFSRLDKLKSNEANIILRRGIEVGRGWSFSNQIRTAKQSATIAKHNPKTKQLVTASTTATGKTSADQGISRGNATDMSQATAKSSANLEQDNDPKATGRLTGEGDIRLIAGANFTLSGFLRFDGKCLITKATHRISRGSGYTTSIDFIGLD